MKRVFTALILMCALLCFGSTVGRAQTGQLSDLDALRYIASHPDLIAAFGTDAAKGRAHYEQWGIKEGRKITFEPLNYTASHADLIGAFGVDETKSVRHFIQFGFKEGRQTTFNPLRYIASHPDLIDAFGADGAKGARHYIEFGFKESRKVTFDPLRYTASHPDLVAAFGGDEAKATTHYIQFGYKEKRQTTFSDLDALQYVASFADLIQSVGTDVVTAIRHYVSSGYSEGRRIVFDALAYIASYGDLMQAFGTDAVAGAKHYISFGYKEGRRVIFDAAGYLATHADLQQVFGSDTVAATRHYINWGFKEKRSYAFTVTVITSGEGSASNSRLYVNAGERATIKLTPGNGSYIATASGCGGSLSGDTFTTGPISGTCQVSVAFKIEFADVNGTVSAFDKTRPAFVTLVSATNDAVLETKQLDSSGSFSFPQKSAGVDYYVKFEQPGYQATAAQVDYGVNLRFAKNESSIGQQIRDFFTAPSNPVIDPGAVAVSAGDKITFTTSAVKGLTDNEFNYRWESTGTLSGSEFVTYLPNPTRVEALGKIISVSNTEAATRLADSYGIVLVNPSINDSPTEAFWTEEYADRLFDVLSEMPFAKRAMESTYTTKRVWPGITRIRLSKLEIVEDVSKSTSSYIGGDLTISSAAFVNATPQLARIDGRKGIFYSNRLFRVALRIATEDGTQRETIKEIFRSRYGLRVATIDAEGMIVRPNYCEQKPEYRRDCEPEEWRAFSPNELLYLASIFEEYPKAIKDISGFQVPLTAVMRRRDGSKSPLNPLAAALAHVNQGFAEYTQMVFTLSDRQAIYANVVHEKAHFIWLNIDPTTRLDWLRLSGWWRNPVAPGTSASTSGNCDLWRKDFLSWNPPNTTDIDIRSNGLNNIVIGHDGQRLDEAQLRNGWGNCAGGVGFVSGYASTNPGEDFADSFGTFMTSPDYLRTVSIKKYEFIRDRIMQGTVYVSRIREDLTFQVYNYYPDYQFPGQIKTVDVKVIGAAASKKIATIRVEFFQSDCGKESCPNDIVSGSGILRSRHIEGNVFGAARLNFGFRLIRRGVLEATFTIESTAPAGFYSVEEFSFVNRIGTPRRYAVESEDFGFQMYVNNSEEDLIAPEYVPGSLRVKILDKADPLRLGATSPMDSAFTSDTPLVYVSYQVRETNKNFNYCVADLLYEPVDPSQRLGRPGFIRMLVKPFTSPQENGANFLCEGVYPMYQTRRSGKYIVSSVTMVDGEEYWSGALQKTQYFFSSQRKDTALEQSPEIEFKSSQSDTNAPILEIARCTSADLNERCLRVTASPVNVKAPDGETNVMIYYWVREDQALETASGVGRVNFSLRDPTGKSIYYVGDQADKNIQFGAGVRDFSPTPELGGYIDSGDGRRFPCITCFNFSFSCPVSAPKPCNATTWVQYRAQVVLPRGSVAGIWGLSYMGVEDKIWGARTYDFTELFKFDPYKPSGSSNSESSQGLAGANPFVFEVKGSGGDTLTSSRTTSSINSNVPIDSSLWSSVSNWSRSVGGFVTGQISRFADWLSGRTQDGFSAVDRWMSPLVHPSGLSAPTRNADAAKGNLAVTARMVSQSEDALIGSLYRVTRKAEEGEDNLQQWVLEYRGNTGALFASRTLPSTNEVLWRARFENAYLSTTAWTRVCADRVWTVQDGYELLFHVGDRALQELRPGRLWVDQSAETSVVTDVRCTFGGAIWVEGYAFGVSGDEPPLRRSDVQATRFGFALDRLGGLVKRQVQSAPFDVTGLCAAAANEQQMFCDEAKRAVGW